MLNHADFVSMPPLPLGPPLPAPISLAGPRILLVDDDEDDRYLIGQAFAECQKPHEFFFATDGIDCLGFLGETIWLPDLILLDLNMPRLNGFEVLRHIQAVPRWKDLTVLVLSTGCDEATQQLVLALGAKHCLTKPSQYADYQPLIDQVFRLYL